MDDYEKEINKKRDKAKESQDKINECYQEQQTKIFEMRKIIEDENNHEDQLICRPLLKEKEKEYKNKMKEYKNNHENWTKKIKQKEKEIDDIFNEIISLKKKMKLAEKSNESTEIEKFEKKRREILDIVSGYIHDKSINQAMIDKVKKIVG